MLSTGFSKEFTHFFNALNRFAKACIQRRGSILAWIIILSFYGADTIAEVKLLISPFFCADLLIYEINCWVFKQFYITCNNFYIINN
jgi:hypothetical protein